MFRRIIGHHHARHFWFGDGGFLLRLSQAEGQAQKNS
jgi:hypothetical protein